jgi:photosystem II stability/assembly factor-like uncharacterized protein
MMRFTPFSQKVFKNSLIAAAFMLTGFELSAQPWMNDSLKNFYDIQRSFNEYWEGREIEKGKGWKQFKRWEYFWEQRVAPTGEFPNPMQLLMERPVLLGSKGGDRLLGGMQSNPWKPLGPSQSKGGGSGIGRANCIVTHPVDPNIIWIGTAAGGAWKSPDGGKTWSTATDLLPTLGVTDIGIDPKNPDIMYLATGDGDNHSVATAYSVGLLKSTDGGKTWNTTGLNFNTSQMVTMSRMLIHPDSTNVLIVAGSNGIFRSNDGGETWVKPLVGTFKDIEFKPNDPSVVYAGRSNGAFFRSEDNGQSWTLIKTGLPTSNAGRIALGVSPDDPSIVYALFANSSNAGFLGLYVSYDSGETWEMASNTPNILHSSLEGKSTGGQGWYDLALAVSQHDASVVYVGGVNIWRSRDIGETWERVTTWWDDKSTVDVVHADHHSLYFVPNTTKLYVANDGGIFSSNNGTEWEWLGNGLQITQFYRLGTSVTNSNKVIAGAQDNGTKLFDGSSWADVYGGDGMEASIDPTNENIIYACSQYGGLGKSVDGGKSFLDVHPPDAGKGGWIMPYTLNPKNPASLFVGYSNVWKSSNRGVQWTKISNFTGNATLNILKVAPSDSNTIYASTGYSVLRRTVNGGTDWTGVALPAQTAMTSLEIHPTNPLKIWATFSGYAAGKKVYTSSDGGSTWINLSGNLPNIPANTIVYQLNSPDRLYVGTDVGVYHIDSTLSAWDSFNRDLPNVIISELEIQYSSGKLRAATFGRGLWEADIILGTVGINVENTISKSDVVVMPNPAQNHISIECPAQNFEKVVLKLVDMTGKELLKTEMTAGADLLKGSLELHSVPNGTYLLNIQTSLKTYSVKVSVNR